MANASAHTAQYTCHVSLTHFDGILYQFRVRIRITSGVLWILTAAETPSFSHRNDSFHHKTLRTHYKCVRAYVCELEDDDTNKSHDFRLILSVKFGCRQLVHRQHRRQHWPSIASPVYQHFNRHFNAQIEGKEEEKKPRKKFLSKFLKHFVVRSAAEINSDFGLLKPTIYWNIFGKCHHSFSFVVGICRRYLPAVAVVAIVAHEINLRIRRQMVWQRCSNSFRNT